MKHGDVLALVRVRELLDTGKAKQARTSARLSVAEVAELCGVDQATVWRWENGKRKARGEPALKYGRLLDALTRPGA